MRRVAIPVLFLGMVGLAVIFGSGVAERWLREAPEATGETVEFVVEAGEPFGRVAERLEADGLAVSARRLRILARLRDRADRQIHAGTYEVARGTPPDSLLVQLIEGRVRLVRFVVPEGFRLEQIAMLAESVLGIPATELVDAAADPQVRARLECPAPNLEGYLFPETYFFPDGIDAAGVVNTLTGRFTATWRDLRGRPPLDLDRHQAVTLASIVESETGVPSERSHVAAVYINRLREGWKLEADPTVRYGLGLFTGRLYYKHLDVDTPYNTYRVAGLPPGPIGSPGRDALQAVLEPLEPCDDFFFVASGDGGHVFSETKAAHDRAVAEYRSRAR
jgi:UPF0755 protein